MTHNNEVDEHAQITAQGVVYDNICIFERFFVCIS
jgi:hypothetical protein